MQKPQIINCSQCSVLLDLYDKIDCSVANLAKNKWANTAYNVSLYFEGNRYEDLLRYKRIVYRKITNSKNIDICDEDLVTLVTKELYKIGKCPKCPC